MIKTRFGLKALGLCALVVGLMAMTASAAQAKGDWTYLDKDANKTLLIFTTAQNAELQVKFDPGVVGVLHFKTSGGTEVLFLCSTIELVPAAKLLTGGTTTSVKVKYSGCHTSLNGVLSKNCEPKTGGGPKGTIETNEGFGLIVLHESKPAILIKPTAGTELAKLELGELCAIGETVPITGEVTLKDCVDATKHAVEHLFEPVNLSGELKALGQSATILGSILARLVGATWTGFEWAYLHLN